METVITVVMVMVMMIAAVLSVGPSSQAACLSVFAAPSCLLYGRRFDFFSLLGDLTLEILLIGNCEAAAKICASLLC